MEGRGARPARRRDGGQLIGADLGRNRIAGTHTQPVPCRDKRRKIRTSRVEREEATVALPFRPARGRLSFLADAHEAKYHPDMSTVTEIKQAVSKLPPRKKLALVRWLRTQVDDRLSDDELMAIAAEGARALDQREAAYAKRKAR